jgi:uncharacterized membrane protein
MEEIAQGNPGGLLSLATEQTVLHLQFGWLVEALDWAAAAIDMASIAILLIGAGRFLAGWFGSEVARNPLDRVQRGNRARIELGRYILAALELFIVSDLIHVALSLKFSDLLFLGLLVVIRSITSFFLDRELAQLEKDLKS